jgi:hypothetical protein
LTMNPNNGNSMAYDSHSQKIHHLQHTLSRGPLHYREHNLNVKHQIQNHNQNGYETDSQSASPALISPTLTYSSHTPSTLSPATPFFGSFQGAQEGFSNQGAGERPGVVSSGTQWRMSGGHWSRTHLTWCEDVLRIVCIERWYWWNFCGHCFFNDLDMVTVWECLFVFRWQGLS